MDHPVVVMCQDCGQQLVREGPWWHPTEKVGVRKMVCKGCGSAYVLSVVKVVGKESGR